jgi:mono/diheme cytochrome c family protein
MVRARRGVCVPVLLLVGLLAWPPPGLTDQAAPADVEAAEVDLGDVERFTDGEPAAGAGLYKQYCRGCHGVDGRGGAHTFMPHVQNLTKKEYIELVPDGYLFTVIACRKAMRSGSWSRV